MTATLQREQGISLVRFLLVQIDSDAAELKRMARRNNGVSAISGLSSGVCSVSRQVAEVEVKRRLVGCLQRLLILRDQPMEKAVRDQAAVMLRALAAPYSDRKGYRPEWHVGHE
jgi:hypothetical protein